MAQSDDLQGVLDLRVIFVLLELVVNEVDCPPDILNFFHLVYVPVAGLIDDEVSENHVVFSQSACLISEDILDLPQVLVHRGIVSLSTAVVLLGVAVPITR